MAGKWDSFTKLLIGARPEQYVRWLMPGATLISTLDIELKARHFFADALLKVILCDQPALVHIELQTYEDPTLGGRMLEYNILAEHQYELPTCSFVIHLRKRRIDSAPYTRRFVDGGITHQFHFRTVKLWEVPAQTIVDLGWEGLLPLLPLTKGGKRPEMVQVMVDRLVEYGDKDLLALAEMLGGLAFTKESEKVWFKRRFAMFQDIMKDSWVYQEMRQEFLEEGLTKGREEGLTKGLAKGREEGLTKGLIKGREEGLTKGLIEGREEALREQRQVIVETIQERFPALETIARQKVASTADMHTLNLLLVNIASTQEVEVVRKLLNE